MGNICRSPSAEGVMRHQLKAHGLAHQVQIDSAGTHNYHPDSPPDKRSQQHAALRGYDISDLRARQITTQDFETYDLILTMDWDNQALTTELAPVEHQRKVKRLAEFFQTNQATVVPDPYYGQAKDFELVLDLIEDGVSGLIQYCKKHLN
jgi:protein-tyrosine phosphatase